MGVYSSDPKAIGQLRILGRKSADIIKSGGEKISAIEIERAILELEGMKDCAVVGVEDEEWGQIVSSKFRLETIPLHSAPSCRAELTWSMPCAKSNEAKHTPPSLQVSVCLVTTRPDMAVAHLREELRNVLAPYKLPKKLKLYEGEIPRNVSGVDHTMTEGDIVFFSFPFPIHRRG